jgi:putative tricarboxylic transport membrane protein
MIQDIFTVIDFNFILFVFLGAVAGLFVGAMPGLSVTMATALLVSITFTWETNYAMALIMGVYVVGVFSGAITAILINIPGAPGSVATTLDGYPMAKNGRASLALKTATLYSFLGSIIGLLILAVSASQVTKLALAFSPFDYFLLAAFGLTTVGSLTSKNFTKGLISAALGVFISTIGMDPIMGIGRFTFGIPNLQKGIPVIATLIGLFGFSEIFYQISKKQGKAVMLDATKDKVTIRELVRHWGLGLRSSVIGTLIGALPGAGGPVASLLAYDQAKRSTKNPRVPFGEGAVEGIVASESANNGCIGGALIPMLTLAVPGDAVTAVILSAFYVHGLRPGPLLFRESPEMFGVILAGGFIGCFMILLLGLTVGPLLAKIAIVPQKHLLPIVAILCVIGAYAASTNSFDILIMIIFGFIGFVMRKRGFPVAPMVLGLVLGGIMDSNFRRAISLASSSPNPIADLFLNPISIVLVLAIVFSIVSKFIPFQQIFGKILRKKKEA